jgi:hypothetical protein
MRKFQHNDIVRSILKPRDFQYRVIFSGSKRTKVQLCDSPTYFSCYCDTRLLRLVKKQGSSTKINFETTRLEAAGKKTERGTVEIPHKHRNRK